MYVPVCTMYNRMHDAIAVRIQEKNMLTTDVRIIILTSAHRLVRTSFGSPAMFLLFV